MVILDAIRRIRKGLRRALKVLARPVRHARGRGGLVIQAYRGYGSHAGVFLMGRVFRGQGSGSGGFEENVGRDILDIGRRLVRHGCANAVLAARFCGAEKKVVTDRDGYFRVLLKPVQPPPADRYWHCMELELIAPAGSNVRAEADLFIPRDESRFVVISDIDDTVIFTGVANKIMMLWRLFTQGPRSRIAFPGVAAFYRALHGGAGGDEMNPLLYVSRGPWSLYEVLDEFFNIHGIPVGPILFLRKWNLSLRHPLPRGARGHKLALIREMLSIYNNLPFVLIGDSGQHDPEIYSRVVRENPGRILAVYIRNIEANPMRRRAIGVLAEDVAAAGSILLLAADSFAMAKHAADKGFISPRALSGVLAERMREGEPELRPTRSIWRPAPAAAHEAVEQGSLAEKLEGDGAGDVQANVLIASGEVNIADRQKDVSPQS
jgi:phosphatidate phosphatase APP1